jgi:hypothetical protein
MCIYIQPCRPAFVLLSEDKSRRSNQREIALLEVPLPIALEVQAEAFKKMRIVPIAKCLRRWFEMILEGTSSLPAPG